ncbi:nitroreductase family deazaflavin-dependent oxidoreductase [Knoellia locipacati]|uniref:nitroreductase family deazaflavin-dependent oxidoreductase n=1 Tax=Knoellia locipacati TaxID=882824 RepID=UPI00384F7408
MAMSHSMLARGNAMGVWMHRFFKGRLDGGGKVGGVLMITSPGRRTGLPRSTMVRYLEDGDDYLVWGTGSGRPSEPDWFRNLRRTRESTIEIGTRSRQVRPEVLEGSDRDTVWLTTVLAQIPGVEKYERKSGRTIPVARLHPL